MGSNSNDKAVENVNVDEGSSTSSRSGLMFWLKWGSVGLVAAVCLMLLGSVIVLNNQLVAFSFLGWSVSLPFWVWLLAASIVSFFVGVAWGSGRMKRKASLKKKKKK